MGAASDGLLILLLLPPAPSTAIVMATPFCSCRLPPAACILPAQQLEPAGCSPIRSDHTLGVPVMLGSELAALCFHVLPHDGLEEHAASLLYSCAWAETTATFTTTTFIIFVAILFFFIVHWVTMRRTRVALLWRSWRDRHRRCRRRRAFITVVAVAEHRCLRQVATCNAQRIATITDMALFGVDQ
jgi:hypothetical protein